MVSEPEYPKDTEDTAFHVRICFLDTFQKYLPQPQNTVCGHGGWPTGNGEKLSCTQAQLGQAACLAVD